MDPAAETRTAIDFGRFQVLLRRRELLADKRPLELGGRAFDVLMALIEAEGAVVSKDALIERVWPGRIVEDNNLQTQISALRRAFGADRGLIRTIAGRGYQFTGEIRTIGTTSDARAPAGMRQPTPTLPHPQTNLPEPVSELIGRDVELAEVLEISAAHRLLTLAGAGGIGKTRLGYEVARHLLPRFAEGVWAIELAPLSDPELVPVTVATALGLEVTSGTASPHSVATALRSKQLMLVLDNCEHVIDAAAAMAEALLRANPTARVIATSREPLRSDGEWIYPVPPLAVPKEGSPDSEDPLRYGAVRLFFDRARAAAPSISSDARTATAIAGICRRLDGIPLAIELAAARAAALGVEGVGARLDDRFRLLGGGRRTALPRHQTLRATLDWSYDLLTEPQRLVLRRLAIFAGGFTLQAVSAVSADDEIAASEVVDCVADLITKSLVTVDAGGARVRYRLLETTRAYALERLVQAGEFDAVARRHARHYLDLFESTEATAQKRRTDEWLTDDGPGIDNVRAALDWAFSANGDASIGVALTAAAVPLWMRLSLMEECHGRAERALAAIAAGAGGDVDREMQLRIALAISLMYIRGAGVSEIGAAGTKALDLAESLGNAEYRLRALFGLWSFSFNSGQHSVALTLAQRFHTQAITRPDPIDRLIGERMIGSSQYYLGELVSARRHLERVLAHSVAPTRKSEIIRFEGDEWAQARAYLARTQWLLGLPDQAMRTAETSVVEARATNHAITLGLTLLGAACPIALWVGDLAAAEDYAGMLLADSTRYALPRWRVFGRCYQGMIAIRRGDVSAGLALIRAAFGEPAAAGSAPRLIAFLISAVSGHVGQIADGLPALEEAIIRSELTEERWLNAELLRVRGELCLLRGGPGATAAAEGCFQHALDWARRQGALSWELRAATSFARMLRDQSCSAEASALLQPIYYRFTEGFDTADLRAANTLLDNLT
jgi:predicted ATPase/DNA-binding winged helix-turn-helix (wHTH) protein